MPIPNVWGIPGGSRLERGQERGRNWRGRSPQKRPSGPRWDCAQREHVVTATPGGSKFQTKLENVHGMYV